MNEQALKQLIAQGLGALKAGGEIGAKAADDVESDAKDQQLKAALQEAGGSDVNDNPIIEAHYEVGKRIRNQAPDDFSRDLGIIAAAQLALHYWIASFGTMRAYAKRANLSQTEQEMAQSLQEAEQADKKMTDIAISIMGG